jgi:hypothetical protein
MKRSPAICVPAPLDVMRNARAVLFASARSCVAIVRISAGERYSLAGPYADSKAAISR